MSVIDLEKECIGDYSPCLPSDVETSGFGYYKRRVTNVVNVANVKIGGGNPIIVQSMTSGKRTNPNDFKAIARDESVEAIDLAAAGSEMVRIAVNNDNVVKAGPYIREAMDEAGHSNVPLVACGQYEIAEGIRKYPDEIKSAFAKIRINPGNVGFGNKYDANFAAVIKYACKHSLPIRIGVNWGSIDKQVAAVFMDENAKSSNPWPVDEVLRQTLIHSVLVSAKKAEEIGLPKDKIILSCKVSKISDLICLYSVLAEQCNYPLHLGLTEAGIRGKAVISTAAGLSILLSRGIGDTIRASLTPVPGEKRKNEVMVCRQVLQSLGLRSFVPQITSCPGCGRTNGVVFQRLAANIDLFLKGRMAHWQKMGFSGVEDMQVAVMGCIVNGPGESKHANLGISLPGYGESPVAVVFMEGKKHSTLRGNNIEEEFKAIIEGYVEERFAHAGVE